MTNGWSKNKWGPEHAAFENEYGPCEHNPYSVGISPSIKEEEDLCGWTVFKNGWLVGGSCTGPALVLVDEEGRIQFMADDEIEETTDDEEDGVDNDDDNDDDDDATEEQE
jgi:hypothetical protein